MKKVLAILLAMVLTLVMSATVIAAPGQFVNSPSNNSAPTLIAVERDNGDCTADVIITPFKDRDTLPADEKAMIEKAYGDIANSKDLTSLNGDLASVASDRNIPGSALKVSDLFNVGYTGCEDHDASHSFTITLGADTLHRFVGLLYMNANGEWELIKNAQVINNGEALKFSFSNMGPFAIVVDTSDAEGDSPQTGILDNDHYHIYIYGALMLVSAMAIVFLIVKGKKYA